MNAYIQLNTRLHVDEITALTWIAAGVVLLLTVTAMIFAGSERFTTATIEEIVPPIIQPILKPPETA